MKIEVIVVAIALFLITLLVVSINIVPIKADTQASTIVFVDSPMVEGTVIGENITVNINVSGVTNLFGWQAGVTFNPKVLNCIEYYEGEFLSRAVNRSINPANGTVWCGTLRQPRWNNTEGIIYYHGCSVLGPVPGVDGNGQLGYLVFEVVGIGVSDLHLTDVILVNSEIEVIPHEVVDIFTVSWGEVDYSIETISNLTGIMNPPNPPSSGIFHHTFSPEEKTIGFDVITEYDNFLNVIIPAELLGGDLKVMIDDSPVSYSLTKNDTHASLYFTHGHSIHNIKIKGTTVIPEFPPTIALPLSMILTLLAVVFAKRRTRGKPKT
jgi:hypothetical protein